MRNKALKILNKLSKSKNKRLRVDVLVHEALEDLSEADKKLLNNIVYGTLERQISIDEILKKFIKKGFSKLDDRILNILRIAVYQILYLDKIPDYAVVNEAVNQAKRVNKRYSRFVNGVLRSVIRNENSLLAEINKSDSLSVRYSIPDWIIEEYQNTFSDQTEEVLEALVKRAPLSLRVLETDYDRVFKYLEELGLNPRASTLPEIKNKAIIIEDPSSFSKEMREDLVKEGLINFQDQGSILIPIVLDPKPGERVLDMCAAPGGKTLEIESLMDNQGEITALEISENRADKMGKRLKDQTIIDLKVADASQYVAEYKDSFDKILVDVPCSGLGVFRRKPDILLNAKKEDLKTLTKIQKKILENAYRYLKTGGELVYSTCTVGQPENEEIKKWFLDNHQNVEILSERHLSPLDSNSDCFYYFKLKKLDD